MQFKQFQLDRFQEEAFLAIENNQSVVVSAPTGSGKTLIADFIISKHYDDQKRIVYTAPIKALSNQKYKDFCQEYGEQHIGLMTGDIVINPSAQVLIMTTEIYRNMAISNDPELENIAYVIFDEVHYINDVERGYVWEESVIYSPLTVRFLCLSATIPNAKEFADWIAAIKKHEVKTVVESKRLVPLQHLFFDVELGICQLEDLRQLPKRHQSKGKRQAFSEPNHTDLLRDLGPDKLPCFFFSFSRRDCQQKAKELAQARLFTPQSKITEIFQRHLQEAPADVQRLASTRLLKETIPQGIAFHHAGLLPVIKEAVEELFSLGLLRVLYTTETFAVGINMPAKTVCFNSLRKWDGMNFRNLNTKEYFQIAGRAGRRGIDQKGYVISMVYRPTFRYEEVQHITTADVEPIQSQFRLSVNTVLNLLDKHTPSEIETILRLSFFSFQKFGKDYDKIPARLLLARYQNIVRKLRKYDFVREQQLTEKGFFAARVFADEITLGEIFATELQEQLDEYQILLILASLVYEPRKANEFKGQRMDEPVKKLQGLLYRHELLAKERKFLSLRDMTALIHPLYEGKSFFDLLKLTNLLEGDLIRFYGQILDRIGQMKKASTNYLFLRKLGNCQKVVQQTLEGITLL